MPNWCENNLTITGPEEELEQFRLSVKSEESEFDFDKIIPYPDEFKELDRIADAYEKEHGRRGRPKDGFSSGGFVWCCVNWGTKWTADNILTSYDNTQLNYRFLTAWSPPYPIIIRLIETWPTLDFELHYREDGMGFLGILYGCSGKVADDREENFGEDDFYDFENDDEDYEFIPRRLERTI